MVTTVLCSGHDNKVICVIRYGTYIPFSKVEFLVLILCYEYISCNHWGNWVKEHLCTIFETSRESIIISKFKIVI